MKRFLIKKCVKSKILAISFCYSKLLERTKYERLNSEVSTNTRNGNVKDQISLRLSLSLISSHSQEMFNAVIYRACELTSISLTMEVRNTYTVPFPLE